MTAKRFALEVVYMSGRSEKVWYATGKERDQARRKMKEINTVKSAEDYIPKKH